jgi:hypothetical protein
MIEECWNNVHFVMDLLNALDTFLVLFFRYITVIILIASHAVRTCAKCSSCTRSLQIKKYITPHMGSPPSFVTQNQSLHS